MGENVYGLGHSAMRFLEPFPPVARFAVDNVDVALFDRMRHAARGRRPRLSARRGNGSLVEVAAELREKREEGDASPFRPIAHFGGDADPAATMQALAGEILRVRHAMSQIVKLMTLAIEGRDAVLVRARPMSPPMASASGS
jgi:hypothetical protein